MDVSFFCRFSLPFQTQTKNAFPGTLAGKGVLCVTNTVKPNVKLGVFCWLGLAWLGLAWLARNVPFVYPYNLFKISKNQNFLPQRALGFRGFVGFLVFLVL